MTTATELLRRALEAWDDEFSNIDNASVFREIRSYLANQETAKDEAVAIIEEADYGCWGQILPDKSVRLGQFLYLHPADPNPSKSIKNQEVDRTRKPMTPKERSDSYIELEETVGPDAHLLSFLSGIAAAERYHKILGGSDE
jgi:hypothetical protein